MSQMQVCVEYGSSGYVLLSVPWELVRIRVSRSITIKTEKGLGQGRSGEDPRKRC